jgi:hypothetical protein
MQASGGKRRPGLDSDEEAVQRVGAVGAVPLCCVKSIQYDPHLFTFEVLRCMIADIDVKCMLTEG